MRAKHNLHVAPTEPLLRSARDQVSAGRHGTASGIVRAVLRPLIRRDGIAETPLTDAPAGPPVHG